MSSIIPIGDTELSEQLQDLPGWSVQNAKLHAEFTFANFIEAFAFMTKVAMAAERANHHPEWSNVYSRVTIDLVTHEANHSISRRDIKLAREILAFASR